MYETIVDNYVWPLLVIVTAGLGCIWWKWLRKKQGHDDSVNVTVNVEGLGLGGYDPAANAPDEVKRKANEILELARDESARGHVLYSPHFRGVGFKVGKFTAEITDPKEQAVIKGAIELLVDRDDLDEQNDNVFVLTAKGYQSMPIQLQDQANNLTKDLERTRQGTWYSKTEDQHFCSVCMASRKKMPVLHAGGSSTAGRCANIKDCGGHYPNLFPQYGQTTEDEERGSWDSRYDS